MPHTFISPTIYLISVLISMIAKKHLGLSLFFIMQLFVLVLSDNIFDKYFQRTCKKRISPKYCDMGQSQRKLSMFPKRAYTVVDVLTPGMYKLVRIKVSFGEI